MAANLACFLLATLTELRALACRPFPAISEATWLGLGSELGLGLGLRLGLGLDRVKGRARARARVRLDLRGDLPRQEGLCLLVHCPLDEPRAPDQRTIWDLPCGAQLIKLDGRDWASLFSRDGVEPGEGYG